MHLCMLSGSRRLPAHLCSRLGCLTCAPRTERSDLSLEASPSGEWHALSGLTGSVHSQEANAVPFVSTTGFLNSDGSTFTAHIATNVSSSPSPCHVAASLC